MNAKIAISAVLAAATNALCPEGTTQAEQRFVDFFSEQLEEEIPAICFPAWVASIFASVEDGSFDPTAEVTV